MEGILNPRPREAHVRRPPCEGGAYWDSVQPRVVRLGTGAAPRRRIRRPTHRSRHCLPTRPGNCSAIMDHFLAPCMLTRRITSASSCTVGEHAGRVHGGRGVLGCGARACRCTVCRCECGVLH